MDKVVLDHSWVAKSLAAGRALGEVDQWGDCLTQDDGLPLDADAVFDDEAEQEEQPKNKSVAPLMFCDQPLILINKKPSTNSSCHPC